MTVTLHWWALPLAIVVIGFIFAYVSEKNDSGMFSGVAAALMLLAAIVVSLAVVLGHFI